MSVSEHVRSVKTPVLRLYTRFAYFEGEGWMMPVQLQLIYRAVVIGKLTCHMLPAPGGVSPVHPTDSVSKPSYAEGATMVWIISSRPTYNK